MQALRLAHQRPAALVVASVVAALLTAASPPASAASAPTARAATASGVEVWVTAVPGAREVSVRLDVLGGLSAEGQGSWGQSAATAAWLWRAPTLEGGEGLEAAAHRSGLSVEVVIGWSSVALVLTGPRDALAPALWLATGRLRPAAGEAELGPVLREALWLGAESTRFEAVGPAGDRRDAVTRAVLGPTYGHSAFASRLRAMRADGGTLETLASEAIATAPVRLLIAAPPDAVSEAWRVAVDDLAPLPARPPPPAAAFTLSDRLPRAQTPALTLVHNRDGRHHAVAGWDLSGGARALNLDLPQRDALLLVLESLLGHPGGPLRRELVRERAAVRDLDVEVRDGPAPVLLVEAEARGTTPEQARALVVSVVERLVTDRPQPGDLRGARAAAAEGLRRHWRRPASRVGLLSALASTGRVGGDTAPESWLAAVLAAMARVEPGHVSELAAWVLREDRRTVADITPETPAGPAGVSLDADLLGTYVRIMVDTRCPRLPIDAADLLRKKYAFEARTYIAITRAIAQRPDVMRALSEEAELRCLEYAKLRSLMPMDRAIGLHEALACGPGQQAPSSARERDVARILRRFDIDPSWYRPLIAMWREDLEARDALATIDARCPVTDEVP